MGTIGHPNAAPRWVGVDRRGNSHGAHWGAWDEIASGAGSFWAAGHVPGTRLSQMQWQIRLRSASKTTSGLYNSF